MNTLLIDDERDFFDGRAYDLDRHSADAVQRFSNDDGTYNGISYETVWLDFSLRGSDSIMDFLFFAARMAQAGTPLQVERFVIHTSSWDGASLIKTVLEGAGYTTVRFDITQQGSDKTIGTKPSGD